MLYLLFNLSSKFLLCRQVGNVFGCKQMFVLFPPAGKRGNVITFSKLNGCKFTTFSGHMQENRLFSVLFSKKFGKSGYGLPVMEKIVLRGDFSVYINSAR